MNAMSDGAGFRLDHDGLKFRHGFGRIDLLLHVIERHAQAIGDLRQELFHFARDRRATAGR